jgi:hypothetical protein
MGVSLASAGLAQVSMNLVNYELTPIPRVLETIRCEASRYGVAVAGTELIGAMPAKAIEEIMRHYLQCHNFNCSQILELNCLPDSQPDSEPNSQPDSEPNSQPDSEPKGQPDSEPNSHLT